VYAERARKKRLGKLRDANDQVGDLRSRNQHLEGENRSLKQQLDDLKNQLRRFQPH
jgi:predicted RNase H-like nuclease (RuvC/YqgF family)